MTIKIVLSEGDKTVTLQISEAELKNAKDEAVLIAAKINNAIYMLGRAP